MVRRKASPKVFKAEERERTPPAFSRPFPVRSEKPSEFKLREPPEMVRPLEVERPPVWTPPAKVEVAVVEVACTTPKMEVEAVTKFPADMPLD